MKTGLVLEGGAMRGMYTAGVLDVFLENQIKFDGIIGVSAGALFGVNYLSGQKGRVIRYNKRFAGKMFHVSCNKHGILFSFCHTYFIECKIFWIRKHFICCKAVCINAIFFEIL